MQKSQKSVGLEFQTLIGTVKGRGPRGLTQVRVGFQTLIGTVKGPLVG